MRLEDHGLHPKIWMAANDLLKKGRTDVETFAILREVCNEMDRPVSDREIWSAIRSAQRRVLGLVEHHDSWPPVDQVLRAEVLRLYMTEAQHLKVQPRFPASQIHYLRSLYRETDLICVGRSNTQFETLPLDFTPRDLSKYEFINPSPMSALSGPTQEGKWSAHTKANTGPRVYGVVEFDQGTMSEHAAILGYLASKLPLVMMVFSGHKSLHGWFKTSHVTEEQTKGFYDVAVMLGADSKLYSPCQFARLPMGTHGTTARRQLVIYFNPENVYHAETR